MRFINAIKKDSVEKAPLKIWLEQDGEGER